MAGQASNYQTSALVISLWIAFPSLKPQAPGSFLSWGWHILASASWLARKSHIFGAPVCTKLSFSPINLSYVNLSTGPTKEPRREEGKNFQPLELATVKGPSLSEHCWLWGCCSQETLETGRRLRILYHVSLPELCLQGLMEAWVVRAHFFFSV